MPSIARTPWGPRRALGTSNIDFPYLCYFPFIFTTTVFSPPHKNIRNTPAVCTQPDSETLTRSRFQNVNTFSKAFTSKSRSRGTGRTRTGFLFLERDIRSADQTTVQSTVDRSADRSVDPLVDRSVDRSGYRCVV